MMDEDTPLYRREAVIHQRQRLHGEIRIDRMLRQWLVGLFLMVSLAVFCYVIFAMRVPMPKQLEGHTYPVTVRAEGEWRVAVFELSEHEELPGLLPGSTIDVQFEGWPEGGKGLPKIKIANLEPILNCQTPVEVSPCDSNKRILLTTTPFESVETSGVGRASLSIGTKQKTPWELLFAKS